LCLELIENWNEKLNLFIYCYFNVDISYFLLFKIKILVECKCSSGGNKNIILVAYFLEDCFENCGRGMIITNNNVYGMSQCWPNMVSKSDVYTFEKCLVLQNKNTKHRLMISSELG
jgi:hypothetical protein